MSIEVNNECGVDINETIISELSRFVLAAQRVHPQAELSLVFVDEVAMAQLHERWMNLPGPTDVMSFPMDELRPGQDDEDSEPGLLGDVVLCPSVARRQAEEAGHSLMEELLLLTTHGILHLLGYDHAETAEKNIMFALQQKLLTEFLAGHSELVS
jgi:probable rRNA maturation factor